MAPILLKRKRKKKGTKAQSDDGCFDKHCRDSFFFFRVKDLKVDPIFFKNKSRSGYYVTKQNK
jgi:hypothetical protein